ncbi:TonB-dependent siderophore receptor [Noviherbaspirillum sp. CPCC 100848]|uniref:TonB-dependent siderophore receptor n=1 Tax=Noviherbaspirillum album TaxID=3080276 RepID=A0ABU6J2N6_9BURK|nr:TonB-dependent siderophore receptor [Noviherbaspirillum sp. CPCC 100848]MEC4717655.1 TonB-dependent siderophore receptor [Noviherbaspirillum sp. CPCC 100848]
MPMPLATAASDTLNPISPAPARLKPMTLAIRMAAAGLLGWGCMAQATAQAQAQQVDAPAVNAPHPAEQAATVLPAVRVTADRSESLPQAYAGGQVARGSRLGVLGNQDIMKAPFSVSSYTSQTIRDQQAATAADVLARDPSVRSTANVGGILDAFTIRGFPIGEGNVGEIAFDGQYGIAPNYRVFSEYAERVEVLKGPAALLYGMSPNSGIGGVVNIVPKRAGAEDLTRVTLEASSGWQGGAHLDTSRRFGEGKQFGVRFNGSHRQGDTPVDKQERKATVGAVALDYQGERFRATLDVIDQRERFDAPSRPFLADPSIAIPGAPDGKSNVTQPWEWARVEDRAVLLRTEYDLNEQLTLFANAGGAQTDVARLFGTPTIFNAAGDTRNTPGYFKFDIDRSTADVGLRSRFAIGSVQHAVTLQASRYRDQLDRGSVSGPTALSNIYAPRNTAAPAVAAPATVPAISETRLSGVALTDTLSMMNDSVLLTVGARRQQVESDNFSPTSGAVTSSYDESAVTPLFGLVVQPWKNVSLYANYIQGLSKGDAAPLTASNAGEVFAPYKAKQHEAGVKVDLGSMIATLSLFQIRKPSGQLTGNVFGVDAEQRNRGMELSVFGEAAKGVRLLGGITLIDAELTKTNSTATRGKTPVGVPEVQANAGAEWDTPWLPGLTLTGGLAYTGKQFVNQANTQRLPSWTRVDLGARYTTRVAGKATTFRANVLNAFDRDYWSGVASYGGFAQGAPRTLLLSASVDF